MGDTSWTIPRRLQPDRIRYGETLDEALRAVLSLTATVPEDAFTASVLGTERAGSGVVIDGDGLVLTIGYLVTEAEQIWLVDAEGRAVPGHPLAVDPATGFGLVQALGRLDLPALPLGNASLLEAGDAAVLAAGGGRERAVATRVVGRQEFAGYWEYLLDDAIFTAPAHPFWGGAGLIGEDGQLLGIGSLILQKQDAKGRVSDLNMIVPIDALAPVIDDLRRYGRVNRPPRPWLGLYATESDGTVTVAGLAENGPAARAGIRRGDRILAVADAPVTGLAGLWRSVWDCGEAGAVIPLRLARIGKTCDVAVASVDRARVLRAPRLH